MARMRFRIDDARENVQSACVDDLVGRREQGVFQ
jgi:hypothetical protein